MLDIVIKENKKYYLQTFLEECEYVQEMIKIENYIADSDSNEETDSNDE